MFQRFIRLVSLSCAVLITATSLACNSDEPRADIALDAASAHDTRDSDAAAQDAGEEDADDASDARDDSEDGGDDTELAGVAANFDPSDWQQENPCSGEVTFPEDNEEFSLPSRPQPSQRAVISRDEFLAELGFVPSRAASIRPGEALLPGEGRSFELFAEAGTDIPIHIYSFNDVENVSRYSVSVTVMVDYTPVEAQYVRWSPDRSKKLLETTATGVNFALESDFEIVDVTIPSEVFSERRMYEISVSYNITTYDGRPVGEARRFALFNGGYDRPSRPCAEPRLDVPWSDWEETLYHRNTVDDLGPLFFEGIERDLDAQNLNDVEPGETRRMFFSVLRTSSQVGGKPTVLVPLFDGEPFGPVFWVTQGGDGDYRVRTDARKSFEVTFPEEPGVYVVQVATWEDPYLYWRTRDGRRNEDVSEGSSRDMHESSNALHFRVVEPSP